MKGRLDGSPAIQGASSTHLVVSAVAMPKPNAPMKVSGMLENAAERCGTECLHDEKRQGDRLHTGDWGNQDCGERRKRRPDDPCHPLDARGATAVQRDEFWVVYDGAH